MVLTCAEGHNTSPEVTRVERHVDTREWDRGEAAFEFDVAFSLLLLLGFLEARVDDLGEHRLDLVDGELFREL